MKRVIVFFILLLFCCISKISAEMRFYLITVGESTKKLHTMYGHSAIRMIHSLSDTDVLINWGMLDFEQSYFYIKFARGNMSYNTIMQSYESFLPRIEIFYDKGGVSQEIFLNDFQKEQLWGLICEDLKPENSNHYYNFLKDNCATRVRDMLEASIKEALIYPPDKEFNVTFRDILHQCQKDTPWYNLLIDLILGYMADKTADFREQMFIPEYLKNNMSQAWVQDSVLHPLLSTPEVIVEKTYFRSPVRILVPHVCFFLLLVSTFILSYFKRARVFLKIFDILLFGTIIGFGVLLILLWCLTSHQETYYNFNLFWLNPLFIFPLISVITEEKKIFFMITGFYVILFEVLALSGLFPQVFPSSMYIFLMIVLERCYFGWNACGIHQARNNDFIKLVASFKK